MLRYKRRDDRLNSPSYKHQLGLFRKWCDEKKLGLFEVQPLDLQRYFDSIRPNLAPASIRHRQSTLFSFYGFAASEGVIQVSPMASVPREKLARRPEPTGLTLREYSALLTAAEERSDRDAAMILLMMLGGFRLSEVLALNISDVEVLDHNVRLRIRDRRIGETQILPPIVARRIEPLLKDSSGSPLFRTKDDNRMTRFATRDMLARVGRKAGIDGLNAQQLRTLMYEIALASGASPGAVANAAGIEDYRAFAGLVPAGVSGNEHPAFKIIRNTTGAAPLEDLVHQMEGVLHEPGIHPVAPIVVAGAVLEARLRGLVQREGLTFSGQGSLSKYVDTLWTASKISRLEFRQLQVLLELRNQAAHGVDLGAC